MRAALNEYAQVGPRAVGDVPLTARNLRNLAWMAVSWAWPPNALVIARNWAAVRRDTPWANYVERSRAQGESLDTMIARALGWICRSQNEVGSGGVGDLRFGGWTPGYPEVTGYIIPTFWDYHAALGNDELAERAIRMADWELRVQKPEGGFESLYEGEGQPPVNFNTGQILRGLVRTHLETREQCYLDAAVRAGDWMVATQESDGSWAKWGYLGLRRTYDTYAAAGLAQLWSATGDDRYAKAALANSEFAIANQRPNGWFDLCANTRQRGGEPITHTLCYASDGLIEIGEILGEPALIERGELPARAMIARVEPGGRLPGRFDSEWRPKGSEVVLTGSAQLGILATKIHRRTGDEEALRVSRELLDFLAFVQALNSVGRPRRGAIAGSFPIWGRYVPLKYPSWATKYFLDQILLIRSYAAAEGRT